MMTCQAARKMAHLRVGTADRLRVLVLALCAVPLYAFDATEPPSLTEVIGELALSHLLALTLITVT